MSLFDYHGQFSRSQDNSDSSSEDIVGVHKASSKGTPKHQRIDASKGTPKHLKKEASDELEKALIEDDAELEDSDDVRSNVKASHKKSDRSDKKNKAASKSNSYDETAERDDVSESDELAEESENRGKAEEPEEANNEASGEISDEASDDEVETDDNDQSAISSESDTSDKSDSSEAHKDEDAPRESSDGKTPKTKKTPASKGKHAAGVYALPLDEVDNEQLSPKKTRGVLKGLGIAACVVVVLAVLVYGAGVLVFTNRILPNTVVSSHDISLYTNEEATNLLQSIENNYTIEVKMGTFGYRVTKGDIGLQLDAPSIVEAIHEQYEAFKWPLYIFDSSHDTSHALNVVFDPAGYEAGFLEAIDEYNKTATPPTDAFIYFDEEAKRYLVKNEVMGTQIDPTLALAALSNAISDLQPILRLTEAELVQPKVRSNDEFIIESAKLANSLSQAKISLVVNDEPVRNISSAELSKCILINENLEVTFDEKALKELCAEIAKEFNTIGTERQYTRADGKVVTVKDGSYGWGVNEDALKDALLEAIMTGDAATVVVPFETTAEMYLGPGQRDWGNRYIDVDLSEQYVRFYGDDGTIIWETPCITGSPDGYHNTPQGVWYVTEHMASPSQLVGYEGGRKIYVSYVTYWMPFIKNSIGLHDATWQPSFGGSMYANGYGSHGCVNISYNAARELWGLIREGDVVVTHF